MCGTACLPCSWAGELGAETLAWQQGRRAPLIAGIALDWLSYKSKPSEPTLCASTCRDLLGLSEHQCNVIAQNGKRTSSGGKRCKHQDAACSALVNRVTASCGFCVGTKPYCDRKPAQQSYAQAGC